MREVWEILGGEYDSIEQISANEWCCYIRYLDEFQRVHFNGSEIWGYNPAVNHNFLIA
jgi:hypothetical protein